MFIRPLPWMRILLAPDGEGGGGGGEGGAGGAGDGEAGGGGAAPAGGAPAGGAPAAAAGGDAGGAPAFDWGKWSEGLKDESQKAYAKAFKSPDDLLAGAMNLRREISTRIKVPGKDAKPEEVAAFRAAIGAKEKAEDYKVATPDGYEMGEVQTALASSMQAAAAEAGVPANAFEAFTKRYFEFEKQVHEQVAGEVQAYLDESTAALKKDFGKDFEAKARAARQFIDGQLKVPEFSSLLEDTVEWNGRKIQLGSHPAVVKMLATIAERTMEDGVIGYRSESEIADKKAAIQKLEREHPIGRRSHEVDAQIRKMYEELYP